MHWHLWHLLFCLLIAKYLNLHFLTKVTTSLSNLAKSTLIRDKCIQSIMQTRCYTHRHTHSFVSLDLHTWKVNIILVFKIGFEKKVHIISNYTILFEFVSSFSLFFRFWFNVWCNENTLLQNLIFTSDFIKLNKFHFIY